MQPEVLAAAIGLCLAGVVHAAEETPPAVLMVIREQVKEGHEAAHARSEEAWPRIFRKGGGARDLERCLPSSART